MPRLAGYYTALTRDALANPSDVKLVVRALLDADPRAQVWTLRPFLDRLTGLITALPFMSGASRPEALMEAYRFIGCVQYVAISLPTLQGIYGAQT